MPLDMSPSIFLRTSANFFGRLFVKHLKSYCLHDDPGDLSYAPNLIISSDSDIRRGNSQKGFAADGYKI
jgi:hypothetical protein